MPEPEDAGHQAITYQELWVRVNEVAAMLRDFAGLKAGDRVTLHLPMVPELPVRERHEISVSSYATIRTNCIVPFSVERVRTNIYFCDLLF